MLDNGPVYTFIRQKGRRTYRGDDLLRIDRRLFRSVIARRRYAKFYTHTHLTDTKKLTYLPRFPSVVRMVQFVLNGRTKKVSAPCAHGRIYNVKYT